MGVKQLWGILKPVCKKEPLENMRGKTLCVDLSTWICQAEETMFLKSAVKKPYLRNTIFRVLCLKRLGTQLIFVTEGTPPQLKWDVIVERARAREEAKKDGNMLVTAMNRRSRGRGRGAKRATKNDPEKADKCTVPGKCQPKKVGRSNFQRKINECAQLLRLLGIPVVKSEGEAEACCALLNNKKVADGCITEDGDTFLYGGEVVYKNLGISSKDPHVYSYSMENIRADLEIDRKEMVALGLLLGCDYSDGVPGIGKQTALKLLKELHNGGDVLERFKLWSKEKKCPESASSIEKQVFRKIIQVEGFPNEEIINEFLVPRDEIDAILPQINWGYPDLVNLQRFCFKHMEWPEEYTLSKLLGVATNEILRRIPQEIPLECPINATRLVKSRIQHGVPLCEVEWKTDEAVDGIWCGYPETFITLESQQSILASLPSLVEEYERSKSVKKQEGKKKGKKHAPSPEKVIEYKQEIANNNLKQEGVLIEEKKQASLQNILQEKHQENRKKRPEAGEDEDSTAYPGYSLYKRKEINFGCETDSEQDHFDQVVIKTILNLSQENCIVPACSSNLHKPGSAACSEIEHDAVDDVVRSLSNLGISSLKESSSRESISDLVHGKDQTAYKGETKQDEMGTDNGYCGDKHVKGLSLRDRLLSRKTNAESRYLGMSSKHKEKASVLEDFSSNVLDSGENDQPLLSDNYCIKQTEQTASSSALKSNANVVEKMKEASSEEGRGKSTTDFNLCGSLENLQLDGALCSELDSCFSSPVEYQEKEDPEIFEKPFGSEMYMEKLRRKLNIVDCEPPIRSPLSAIDSLSNQPDHCEAKAIPVSFMERIRLRSQKL